MTVSEIPADVERETRVEALVAGDRFRWCGRTYTVKRVIGTGRAVAATALDGRRREQLVVDTEEGRTQLFPAGHFVAAVCVPR